MKKRSRADFIIPILLMGVLWLEANVEITINCPEKRLAWDDARLYCQKHYVDLVTWDMVDVDHMTEWLKENNFTPVWVGLHEDTEKDSTWKWIDIKTGEGLTGEDVSKNVTWATLDSLIGSCGSYYCATKMLHKTLCSTTFQFICFNDNLVLVTENKTWGDALSHCRNMTTSSRRYDLLSITNSSDYSYIRDRIYRATTEEVWTGLRFLGGDWWWSDGETLDHREMLPSCPSQWRNCGTLSKNGTNNWTTRDCSEERNFICYFQEVTKTSSKND